MGYADLIADLSETGTTLSENHLRPLDGGVIIESQAVLIGNRRCLRDSPVKLETLREMIERIEAHRRARQFVSLRANIIGESVEDVQDRILANPALSGTKGPGVGRCRQPARHIRKVVRDDAAGPCGAHPQDDAASAGAGRRRYYRHPSRLRI